MKLRVFFKDLDVKHCLVLAWLSAKGLALSMMLSKTSRKGSKAKLSKESQ